MKEIVTIVEPFIKTKEKYFVLINVEVMLKLNLFLKSVPTVINSTVVKIEI